MDIIIVGAGISGLSAAAVLIKEGVRVIIFEKDTHIGGFAASFRKNNYIFDLGPHIFFGKNIIPELNVFFETKEVIIENQNLKQGIFIQGKLFHYPFQLKEILKKIEKRELPKAIFEVIVKNLTRKRDLQTLEEWVKRRIGKVLFDYIELDSYVGKLYGLPASEISSDWGKHRLKPIAHLNFGHVLNMAVNPWAKKKKRYTYYCPKGIGDIVDNLAHYITSKGGEICLDSQIEKIVVDNGRINEVIIRQDGRLGRVFPDYTIFTGKVTDLIHMIEPNAGSEVYEAANSIRFRDLIILYLVVNQPKIFDNCLVYFSNENTIFKRITEFKHFSKKMAPENMTSLSIEISINPGDEIWRYEDSKIYERVIKDIEKLGIAKGKDVLEYFSLRIPAVYPVYFLNYQRHIEVILHYLMRIENLISIGRHGLYQHDNMPTAIQSGFDIGRLIINHSTKDLGRVNNIVYNQRLKKYQDMA